MKRQFLLFASAAIVALVGMAVEPWPVLRIYKDANLRAVRMPMGGIGTGTVSLSGIGALVDWELGGVPAKGFVPAGRGGHWGPGFVIRCETSDGRRIGRLLEGPLPVGAYEGMNGAKGANHGFPRFASVEFKAAYPLAQLDFRDPKVPVRASLQAMNPLIPGNPDDSGIPAILFRWSVANTNASPVSVSICGMYVEYDGIELAMVPAEDCGDVSRAMNLREPGWNVAMDRFWRTFMETGTVTDSDPREPKAVPTKLVSVKVNVEPGAVRDIPFVLAWRNPSRGPWRKFGLNGDGTNVGNWYATRYPTAESAAKGLLSRCRELEEKTVAFVRSVVDARAPECIREAALFNLSTLRTETCFRTADGNFFGWEGCKDSAGSCFGSCTHVWGYEHALVDLWPSLARNMLDLQFGPQLREDGRMNFRLGLPLDDPEKVKGNGVAAADGQMQCIIKACEYWRKSGDDAWLRKTWPAIRRAVAFCWVDGGWDADEDGVMEGCQHNTMDVEYYGPNPQMGFLYLAALEAASEMGERAGDPDFARKCRGLRSSGGGWVERNLFNGEYYEHRIVPAKDPARIAKGLRLASSGAVDPTDPDYQLGAGCLIDQLLGEFSAHAAGLPSVVDAAHMRTTLGTILEKCRKASDDDGLNPMRDYALAGEESLRMAWYPADRMPKSPFPYYRETMTGFEYVVAALLAQMGELDKAERVVRNIRSRYDGLKRNPFDEAECGHHYARALASWSVFRAWKTDLADRPASVFRDLNGR